MARTSVSEILKLMFFNVCVIAGVQFVTGKGQLLQGLGDASEKLPEILHKPLTGCPECMASVWGTLVYWTLGPRKVILFPFYICGLCGLVHGILMFLDSREPPPEHGRD